MIITTQPLRLAAALYHYIKRRKRHAHRANWFTALFYSDTQEDIYYLGPLLNPLKRERKGKTI